MTILKAALVAAALFVASGTAARAEEWRRLGRDGPVEVAVDLASFGGPQTRRTARTVLVPTEPGDAYVYLVVDTAIDCAARTITGVTVSAHDQTGAQLGQRDLPPENTAVREADGTATLANAVCDGVELTGRSFTSISAFAAWVKQPATQ